MPITIMHNALNAGSNTKHLELMVDSGASMNIEPSCANVFDFKPKPIIVTIGDNSKIQAESRRRDI